MTSSVAGSRGPSNADRVEGLEAQVRDLVRELAEVSQRAVGSSRTFASCAPRSTAAGHASPPSTPTSSTTSVGRQPMSPRSSSGTCPTYGGSSNRQPDPSRRAPGSWMSALAAVSGWRCCGVRCARLGGRRQPEFVDAARARGLDVVPGDAAAHLLGRPANSVDMVTAFHLIEHLDVETLLAFLAAALHALRPGGCVCSRRRTRATSGWPRATSTTTRHRSPLPPALTEYWSRLPASTRSKCAR